MLIEGQINSWISGNIAARIVDPLNDPTGAGAGSSIGWRWGIGMWAIIVPGTRSRMLVVEKGAARLTKLLQP